MWLMNGSRVVSLLAVMTLCLSAGVVLAQSAKSALMAQQAQGSVDAPTVIVAVGDSLTAGYGVASQDAYPHLLQQALNAADTGTRYKVINAGISGATSAGAAKRLRWYLRAKPAVVILALGVNDGRRGHALAETKKNLAAAIELAQQHQAKVLLAGMLLPVNYGEDYRQQFADVFVELAQQYQVPRIPFLLEGVALKPELNLADGIHPNEAGHQIIAQTVLAYLRPLL